MSELSCLSRLTDVVRDPFSVYVVYQPPQIFDECRRLLVGIHGPPVTMSYQSNMMSTLEYRSDAPPATKAMDFADLPCPPSEVAEVYNPGAAYSPVLVSTFGAVWMPDAVLLGAVQDPICDIAAIRDPPVHAHRVVEITGPKDDSGGIP